MKIGQRAAINLAAGFLFVGVHCVWAFTGSASALQQLQEASGGAQEAGDGAVADPYEPTGIIPKGPYRGVAVDTDLKRSIHLLSPEEAAPYNPLPGERLVANFQHRSRWWIARIPEGGVQDIIVQDEDSPGGLGHGQMRIVMKPDFEIVLIPQVPGSFDEPVRMRDFVWTAFGTAPKGYTERLASPKALLKAVKNIEQFLITYRMISLDDDRAIMTTNGKPNSVRQFRLQISDEDKQRVLAKAIDFGSKAGMNEMFNLVIRSCVSQLFAVLDGSLDYGRFRNFVVHPIPPTHLFRHFPKLIPLNLHVRGLLKPGVEIADLRDEFPTAP